MISAPTVQTVDLGGGVRVDVLLDALAEHPLPLPDAFPGAPGAGWEGVARAHPDTVRPSGHWRLPVHCFLIRTPTATLLVDAGVGPSGTVAAGWLGTEGALLQRLDAVGVALDDIDTVVLTHAHQDHVGWLSDPATAAPLLPHARHLVTRLELAHARQLGWPDAVGQALDPLIESGLLETVDPGPVVPGVDLVALPGHTPGHAGLRVTGTQRQLLITGDAFNHPVQVTEPDVPSGADVDRPLASATRRRLAAEAGGLLLAASHLPSSLYAIVEDRYTRPEHR